MQTKNIDSALSFRKQYSSKQMQFLNKYNRTRRISSSYYQWLSSKYKYDPYFRTFNENIDTNDSDGESKKLFARFRQVFENDDYAALNNSDYNSLVYSSFYPKNQGNTASALAVTFDSAIVNPLKGATKEVFLTRFIEDYLRKPDSVFDPIFKKYETYVKNSFLKRLVKQERQDNTLSDIAIENSAKTPKSVDELLSRYKGKVICVDFWASWCLQCRSQIQNAESEKKKLSDKGVVFLYLGYNDKPLAWRKAKQEIGVKGEHYLLTKQMTSEVDKLFQISGLPSYSIIDKDGNIVLKNIDSYAPILTKLKELTGFKSN
jgi:thiol-disulfide isomerase/thioredoxin